MARGYLGLGLRSVRVNRDAAGIAAGTRGAVVMDVDPGGPGARAGIHQGDVVAAWNGAPVGSLEAVLRGLSPASVGTTVRLTLRRGEPHRRPRDRREALSLGPAQRAGHTPCMRRGMRGLRGAANIE